MGDSAAERRVPLDGERLSAARRYEFLAQAARTFAESLDYETTLAAVAGMALPYLGAWCIVDMIESAETVRRVAIVHPDPDKQVLARRLASGWPPGRDDPFGVPAVARTGKPELVPMVTDELLVSVARSRENLEILRQLRIGSIITVPLVARGRVLGAISYVSAESGHGYSRDDVRMAEDLAAAAALAVDNALLHHEVKKAAAQAEAARDQSQRLVEETVQLNERLLVAAVRESKLADSAQAADQAKSTFLATMSHELKTPLSAIIGYVQLIERGTAGAVTEEQRVRLGRVSTAAWQLLQIIDQILTYARIGAEQEVIRAEPTDIVEVAQEAVDLVEPLAASKNLPVRVQSEEQPLRIETDADKVRQILLNLLSNAVKHTDRGEVRVVLSREDGGVRVLVQDTGTGIPREDLERIFEPFEQVEGPGGAARHGSGLGLAVTRELVRLLGGEIAVESELGRGSTFTIWLSPQPG